jgi:DNA-binding NarL/FixJ family response regulator
MGMDRARSERGDHGNGTHHPAEAATKLRAIVVDDEPLARRGLEIRLAEHADVELVGQYGDGAAAIEGLREHRPDLMFLDVQMPGMDGFETLRSIPAVEMPRQPITCSSLSTTRACTRRWRR